MARRNGPVLPHIDMRYLHATPCVHLFRYETSEVDWSPRLAGQGVPSKPSGTPLLGSSSHLKIGRVPSTWGTRLNFEAPESI